MTEDRLRGFWHLFALVVLVAGMSSAIQAVTKEPWRAAAAFAGLALLLGVAWLLVRQERQEAAHGP